MFCIHHYALCGNAVWISFAVLRTLTGHKSSAKSVDFHPYGDYVTSGSLDTNIKVYVNQTFVTSQNIWLPIAMTNRIPFAEIRNTCHIVKPLYLSSLLARLLCITFMLWTVKYYSDVSCCDQNAEGQYNWFECSIIMLSLCTISSVKYNARMAVTMPQILLFLDFFCFHFMFYTDYYCILWIWGVSLFCGTSCFLVQLYWMFDNWMEIDFLISRLVSLQLKHLLASSFIS